MFLCAADYQACWPPSQCALPSCKASQSMQQMCPCPRPPQAGQRNLDRGAARAVLRLPALHAKKASPGGGGCCAALGEGLPACSCGTAVGRLRARDVPCQQAQSAPRLSCCVAFWATLLHFPPRLNPPRTSLPHIPALRRCSCRACWVAQCPTTARRSLRWPL